MFTALFSVAVLLGAPQQPKAPFALTTEARKTVVERLAAELERGYVFPRVAEDMEFELLDRLKSGAYDKAADPHAFAALLTDTLREVSSDKHLAVRFTPDPLPERPRERGEPTAEELEERRREAAWDNFGVESVQRLAGNVGYFDLRAFQHPELAGPAVTAALTLLSSSEALIFDLRENGGGNPEMVRLISSYLFGPTPVHLNSLYFRPTDTTQEFWTLADVPGPRFVGKDVFVLTSNATFSAAEEFSYNLQCLKRATIVGQTTGGGAHPGGMVRLHEHFSAFVPSGRAINPLTKTNWEGVGVKPDVECDVASARARAHALALEHLLAKEKDSGRRRRFESALGMVQASLHAAR
jgi:hypothetical protein